MRSALELALWDSVKGGSPAELESYLKQYPQGSFASLARTRIDAALHPTPDPSAPVPRSTCRNSWATPATPETLRPAAGG